MSDLIADRPVDVEGVRRVVLGGAAVDLVHREELERRLEQQLAGSERPLFVASANLDHLYHFGGVRGRVWPGQSSKDWLVLLDGMPLVRWVNASLGRSWPQLAGSDLLPGVLALAERRGVQVGFLGGWPDQHRAVDQVLARRHPRLPRPRYWAPSRHIIDDAIASTALAAEIQDAAIDLLVVGVGKPRQEAWVDQYGHSTGASTVLCFGAAADFLAGRVKRAPRWMRSACLEWAYRMYLEPRRLARRYIAQAPAAAWRLTIASSVSPWRRTSARRAAVDGSDSLDG